MSEDFGIEPVKVLVADMKRFSRSVPRHTKVAIADVVLDFGLLEATLNEIIMRRHKIGHAVAVDLVYGLDMRAKCEMVRKLIVSHGEIKLERKRPTIFTILKAVCDRRNDVVHSVWHWLDGRTPAYSRSKTMIEGRSFVAYEFGNEKLKRLSELIIHCVNALHDIEEQVAALEAQRLDRRLPEPSEGRR